MDGNLAVKIFEPTVVEFNNPRDLLKKIERDPECQAAGLAGFSKSSKPVNNSLDIIFDIFQYLVLQIIPPRSERHTPVKIPDYFKLANCYTQTSEILGKTENNIDYCKVSKIRNIFCRRKAGLFSLILMVILIWAKTL